MKIRDIVGTNSLLNKYDNIFQFVMNGDNRILSLH